MRLLHLVFSLAILTQTAQGQTFFATPEAVLHQELQFEMANECYIYFDNPSGNSLQLHWRLVESNLPELWDVDLCDYGTCYIGIPSNGLMNPVQDTIQPYLKLIVQPGTNAGSTWIWFRVYEEGNPDNFQDVFYSLHTPGTLSTQTPLNEGVAVCPNPASVWIQLENKQEIAQPVQIFDSRGQRIWGDELPAKSDQQISTHAWPSGVYVLQSGKNRQKIIVQHNR